jgi:hypothetical protein
MLRHAELTRRVIGLAIEVHRTVGPGLLESVYNECLADELEQAGIPFQREVVAPVVYKNKTLGARISCGYFRREHDSSENQGRDGFASGTRRPASDLSSSPSEDQPRLGSCAQASDAGR